VYPSCFHDIPRHIVYKYKSLSRRDEIDRLFTSCELWFACAKGFNDPFDTAIIYNCDGVDTPIAERWAVAAARRHMPDKSDAERAEFVAKRLRTIRNDPNELISMRDRHIEMSRRGSCASAGAAFEHQKA
jgi:hypothetical protein